MHGCHVLISKDQLVVSFSTKVLLLKLSLSQHTLGVFSFSWVRLVEYPQVLRICQSLLQVLTCAANQGHVSGLDMIWLSLLPWMLHLRCLCILLIF